jgi:hypothetical protein
MKERDPYSIECSYGDVGPGSPAMSTITLKLTNKKLGERYGLGCGV